jgi:CDP-glycerol glycerophosphotransferase
LRAAGEPACLVSWRAIPRLARAAAIVSDHGLHTLEWLVRFGPVPAFDVWHGIPFKGFDADDFRVQHRYEEVWVPSPRLAALYVERFGFDARRVHATGYARTDPLVAPDDDVDALRERLGLGHTRGHRLVLFAPTWKQDQAGRSVFPFGADSRRFLGMLDEVCRRHDAMLLFRAHLNSGDVELPDGGRILPVPQSRFPDSEAILRLADVLVCDWSSIAFDFLLLDRPTLFLDVPPPFAKGFSLGPEYRFGEIVADVDALADALDSALGAPDAYRARHGARHAAVRREIYGDCADGRAAERCLGRLDAALARGGSSR